MGCAYKESAAQRSTENAILKLKNRVVLSLAGLCWHIHAANEQDECAGS